MFSQWPGQGCASCMGVDEHMVLMSKAGGVDREGELPGIALGRLSRQACRVSEAMNDTPHFLQNLR